MEAPQQKSIANRVSTIIKLGLEFSKLSRQAPPDDAKGRRARMTSFLDISYEADGLRSIKRGAMNELRKLYHANPDEAHLRTGYAYGIHYLARDTVLSLNEREAVLDSFDELSKNFHFDEKVRELYADSVCYLICDSRSDLTMARRLYSRLKKFSLDFPQCQGTAEQLSYAASRLHDFEILDIERQIELLEELRSVYARFPEVDSISFNYGASLHNSARCESHSNEQRLAFLDGMEKWQAVHKPDDFLIDTASVWRSRAMIQDDDSPELKKRAAELFLKHVNRLHENSAVRENFAYAASNFLISSEIFGDLERDLAEMVGKIHDLYPNDEKIIDGWRRTLNAIALAPDGSFSISRSSALQMLRLSAIEGPFHNDGYGHLVLTLTQLTRSTSIAESQKEVFSSEVSQLIAENPNCSEIHSARALASLMNHCNTAYAGKPAEEELPRLRELHRTNPQQLDLLTHLGNALMNGSTCPGQPDYCKNCLAELKDLQKKFPNNADLVNLLAIAYFNLFSKPPYEVDLRKIHFELEDLAKAHPKNKEVALSLALVFFSGFLGNIDRFPLRFFYFKDLKDISERFPEEEEIQWRYALCLMAVSVISKPLGTKKRLMKQAESRGLYDAAREFPIIARLLRYGTGFETLAPGEVKQILQNEENLT